MAMSMQKLMSLGLLLLLSSQAALAEPLKSSQTDDFALRSVESVPTTLADVQAFQVERFHGRFDTDNDTAPVELEELLQAALDVHPDIATANPADATITLHCKTTQSKLAWFNRPNTCGAVEARVRASQAAASAPYLWSTTVSNERRFTDLVIGFFTGPEDRHHISQAVVKALAEALEQSR